MSNQISRGAAAVGRLSDLGPIEARVVMYLRRWSDRDQARSDGQNSDLTISTGKDQSVAATLDQICMLCAHYGRRPLVRHEIECECLGADESCFAHMVGAASEGAREDALMVASLIVRADVAPALVALSEQLGLALRRVADTHFEGCRNLSCQNRHLH